MKSFNKEYEHLVVSGDDITAVIKGIAVEPLCKVLMDKYHLKGVEKADWRFLVGPR